MFCYILHDFLFIVKIAELPVAPCALSTSVFGHMCPTTCGFCLSLHAVWLQLTNVDVSWTGHKYTYTYIHVSALNRSDGAIAAFCAIHMGAYAVCYVFCHVPLQLAVLLCADGQQSENQPDVCEQRSVKCWTPCYSRSALSVQCLRPSIDETHFVLPMCMSIWVVHALLTCRINIIHTCTALPFMSDSTAVAFLSKTAIRQQQLIQCYHCEAKCQPHTASPSCCMLSSHQHRISTCSTQQASFAVVESGTFPCSDIALLAVPTPHRNKRNTE